MYRYNINQKLVTSAVPIIGYTALSMSDVEARYCIGFELNGNAIYNEVARTNSQLIEKQKLINEINFEFDNNCKKIGISLIGFFTTYDTNEQINNPFFQYDKDSQFMLLQAKDDSRVPFWRSIDNKNIALTNAQMNTLYDLIKLTYYTKFAEKSQEIDSL